jgi:hypothetical protein
MLSAILIGKREIFLGQENVLRAAWNKIRTIKML